MDSTELCESGDFTAMEQPELLARGDLLVTDLNENKGYKAPL